MKRKWEKRVEDIENEFTYIQALNEKTMHSAQQAQIVVDTVGLSALGMWVIARRHST